MQKRYMKAHYDVGYHIPSSTAYVFVECLLCVGSYSRHWWSAVNKTADKNAYRCLVINALKKTARGRRDGQR